MYVSTAKVSFPPFFQRQLYSLPDDEIENGIPDTIAGKLSDILFASKFRKISGEYAGNSLKPNLLYQLRALSDGHATFSGMYAALRSFWIISRRIRVPNRWFLLSLTM